MAPLPLLFARAATLRSSEEQGRGCVGSRPPAAVTAAVRPHARQPALVNGHGHRAARGSIVPVSPIVTGVPGDPEGPNVPSIVGREDRALRLWGPVATPGEAEDVAPWDLPIPAPGHGPGPAGRPAGRRRTSAPRSRRRTPFRREVDLPGGRRLTVRVMRPEDAAGIARLYRGLGEDDLYFRFFGTRPPPEAFVAEMVATAASSGTGLVATLGPAAGSGRDHADVRIVAEASYSPLPDGDGELGITVASAARGWVGPYLLDALLQVAAAHGVANLQADVLVTNGRMLSMLRRRGCAVVDHTDRPSILRITVGTTSPVPSWPPAGEGRRVLIEGVGARWPGDAALRAAGYQVIVCAGPPGGWAACPPRQGRSCPLVAGADLVLNDVPGTTGDRLAEAHARTPVSAPVVRVRRDCADPPGGMPTTPPDPTDRGVVALVRRHTSTFARSR